MNTTTNRLLTFLNYRQHPMLSKQYVKLSLVERELAICFIVANKELSVAEFEMKVNRMFLDKEKPKHWIEISELLTCSNKVTS